MPIQEAVDGWRPQESQSRQFCSLERELHREPRLKRELGEGNWVPTDSAPGQGFEPAKRKIDGGLSRDVSELGHETPDDGRESDEMFGMGRTRGGVAGRKGLDDTDSADEVRKTGTRCVRKGLLLDSARPSGGSTLTIPASTRRALGRWSLFYAIDSLGQPCSHYGDRTEQRLPHNFQPTRRPNLM